MKDRKFHIDKELRDNYPKPGVPVDEAWAEMNKILDAGLPGPPEPGNGSAISGVKRFFWQYALVIVVVTVTMWGYYRKHSDGKTSPGVTTPAGKSEIKEAQPSQYDTIEALDNKTGVHVDKSVAASDSDGKAHLPAADVATQRVNNNAEKDTAAISYNDSAHSLLHGNKTIITVIHNADAVTATNRNDTGKNNTMDMGKNMQHKKAGKNVIGGSLVPGQGGTVKNYDAGKGRRVMHSENNSAVRRTQHPLNLLNHNRPASTGADLVSEIHTPESSVPVAIISFIKEPVSTDIPNEIELDSGYLRKLKNADNSLASSKKHGKRYGSTIKDSHVKSAIGFEYGLQWNAAIPVQGTTDYFRGTDGNSKSYNIILPQVWLSKGLTNNSKIGVTINLNQQYFTGNKQVSLDSISPPDSTFHRKYLSKTSGFGATLEYSYRLHKNWAASIGISYNLNRSALLNKQSINFYNGSIEGDSLYGIKRSSADWRYINKSLVSGSFELYYTFKKFSVGAAVYLPLTNIPVYGNKNIHPVNAQLFLRWNIKKD